MNASLCASATGETPAVFGPTDTATQPIGRVTAQLSAPFTSVRSLARRATPTTSVARPPTLVAVAHGSRDPLALSTVRALLRRVRALRPSLPIRLGHVEIDEPLLADTLADLRGRAVLVPLLLGRGHHVKHDLPEALARASHLRGRVAEPLGPHPLLAEALHDRLTEAGFRPKPGGGVVLAAAGSRDPQSSQDAADTAALLSERLGGLPVLPAVASTGGRTIDEATYALTKRGSTTVAVASYFTAPGRFATECATAAPGIAAAPLGDHPALARLVLHRYDQTRDRIPGWHPTAAA